MNTAIEVEGWDLCICSFDLVQASASLQNAGNIGANALALSRLIQ